MNKQGNLLEADEDDTTLDPDDEQNQGGVGSKTTTGGDTPAGGDGGSGGSGGIE